MLDSKIETYLKVVELKSYTAAANALHLTQPAVTQHIHKLEEHYGCCLIDSSGRSVNVTKAGLLLYDYLALQRGNELHFSQVLHNMSQPLCVGATLSIADYFLPNALVDKMLMGDRRIRVISGNTATLLSLLRRGELDCAFIEGVFDATLFETQVLYKAPFVGVAAANHPLANKGCTLEQLRAYPIVLREPLSGTREVFEGWLRQKNCTPSSFSQLIELGSFTIIKNYVQRSLAVTFLYEAVIEKELASGTLCKLNLEGFLHSHELRFVYRKGDAKHSELKDFFEDIKRGSEETE